MIVKTCGKMKMKRGLLLKGEGGIAVRWELI
jgi:hypothetical protein